MTEYVITAPGMDKDEIKQTVFEMNLDLNFVHNSNLRKGNLKTAYQDVQGGRRKTPGATLRAIFSGKMSGGNGRRQGQGR